MLFRQRKRLGGVAAEREPRIPEQGDLRGTRDDALAKAFVRRMVGYEG